MTPENVECCLRSIRLLEKRGYKTLQKKYGIDETEMRNTSICLRRADPKPECKIFA